MVDPTDIKIDLWNGPPGNCGFRKGIWKAEYDGRTFEFFSSIPHDIQLPAQERLLQQYAAHLLDKHPTLIK